MSAAQYMCPCGWAGAEPSWHEVPEMMVVYDGEGMFVGFQRSFLRVPVCPRCKQEMTR